MNASTPLRRLLYAGLIACLTIACSPQPAPASLSEGASQAEAPEGSAPTSTFHSEADTPRAVGHTPPGEPETLIWKDLLPPGEEEHLAELYDDFYEKLDQKMRGNQVMLTQGPSANVNAIAEGSSLDLMPQLGTFNTVADLDGLKIRLPGYVVPLDFNAKDTHKEFLLAPYQGACIHTPPPPPNQIVYVTSPEGVKIPDIWGTYWVEGVIRTRRHENSIGDAAYTLTLSRFSEYK